MNEIVLLGGADGDLIELYNGFEDRSLGTGGDFDAAFVKACDLLARHPEIGRRYSGEFRRLLMLDWHLGIFYTVTGLRVFIHAIVDVRQYPQQITRRLGAR